MKPIILFVGRCALTIATALGLACYANYQHHKSYWNGTIQRVQTVDLNIMAHMLPTKLSYALIRDDVEELQRTLDSNYGLFGLIVTNCKTTQPDCPEQQIIYQTHSNLGWHRELAEKGIRYLGETNSPYDTLRYPPPLLTEGGYDDPRDWDWNDTGRENLGDIIGRVYYVRGTPPTFWNAYWDWFRSWPQSIFQDSQAYRYYGLTLALFVIGGMGGWAIVEILLAQRRSQRQTLQQMRQRLDLSQRDLAYAQTVVRDRERQLRQQQRSLTEQKAERQRLSQHLQEREAQLRQQQDIRTENANRRRQLEAQIQSLQDRDAITQEEIQQRTEEIQQLEAQIQVLQRQQQDYRVNKGDELRACQESLQRLQTREAEAQDEKLQNANQTIEELNNTIQSVQDERDEAILELERFQQRIQDTESSLSQQRREYETRVEQLSQELAQAQDDYNTLLSMVGEAEQARDEAEQARDDARQARDEKAYELSSCQSQLESLRAAINTNRDPGGGYQILLDLDEQDFYPNEIRDVLLRILESSQNNIRRNSRRYHLILDILRSNQRSQEGHELEQRIERIFRGYTGMNSEIQSSLTRVGFTVLHGSNHYKLKFRNDNRYMFTISSTPSSNHAGEKIISTIRRKLF